MGRVSSLSGILRLVAFPIGPIIPQTWQPLWSTDRRICSHPQSLQGGRKWSSWSKTEPIKQNKHWVRVLPSPVVSSCAVTWRAEVVSGEAWKNNGNWYLLTPSRAKHPGKPCIQASACFVCVFEIQNETKGVFLFYLYYLLIYLGIWGRLTASFLGDKTKLNF